VSQINTGRAQSAETLTQETRTFIRQVRTRTRMKYVPEDKIRIVLEGSRLSVPYLSIPPYHAKYVGKMSAITVQSSRLSSVFPKKNPTAHSKGLSSNTANP